MKKNLHVLHSDVYFSAMIPLTDPQLVSFAQAVVAKQLSDWAAPDPAHIDFEADEFSQQASIDLWLALQKRPSLTESAMGLVIKRSMGALLRKRRGPKGHRTMKRMCVESLDLFEAPASDYPFILYDAIDYVASCLDGGTAAILAWMKRGANTTDIIRAMQISVSSFYLRLTRIQEAMRVVWEN